MKIERTHFERSLTRYKTRTLRVEITVLLTGLAFTIYRIHTNDQTAAESSNEMGYLVGAALTG